MNKKIKTNFATKHQIIRDQTKKLKHEIKAGFIVCNDPIVKKIIIICTFVFSMLETKFYILYFFLYFQSFFISYKMIVQHILLIQCSVKGLIFFVQLFKRTNLGQGIFSLEIFYLFLRRNLTKFGHNLLSLLRNTSSELKLKCFQAIFLKQCM